MINSIDTENRRMILKAIQAGLISKEKINSGNFNINLYTFKELPLFVFKTNYKGLLDFLGHHITEEELSHLKAYYKAIGINQTIITID